MNTQSLTSPVAVRTNFWWEPGQFKKVAAWRSTIELGREFFEEIREHPVPIDLNVLRAMKRSSLGVDIYLWLAYRMNRIYSPVNLPAATHGSSHVPEETAPPGPTSGAQLREPEDQLAWPGRSTTSAREAAAPTERPPDRTPSTRRVFHSLAVEIGDFPRISTMVEEPDLSA